LTAARQKNKLEKGLSGKAACYRMRAGRCIVFSFMRRKIMIKLKLPSVFVLVSIAAAVSGCTVCVDCELQSARKTPLGKVGTTYYYSEEWTEPGQDVTADAESYSSSSEIISTPVTTSYWPSATQPVWQGTSSSAAAYPSYTSSYYPSSSSYYYQNQQPAAVSRQYAYWPYTSQPELPSAAWQARYIGQTPRTMYYYPPVNSFANSTSGSTSALRRYWASPPPASGGGRRPVYLGPVWYYP
jgi:hypothetical protein